MDKQAFALHELGQIASDMALMVKTRGQTLGSESPGGWSQDATSIHLDSGIKEDVEYLLARLQSVSDYLMRPGEMASTTKFLGELARKLTA